MLYQLFDLQRDPAVRSTTFGAMESVGYDLGRSFKDLCSATTAEIHTPVWGAPRAWDGTFTIGLSLDFDTPRQLPIYKSIEAWPAPSEGRRRREGGPPVVLERLLYASDKGMVPFCWRHIDRHMMSSTLVHCQNLQMLHGGIQGLGNAISVHDPRQLYLDTLSDARTWYREENLHELQKALAENTSGRLYSRHEFVPDRITKVLNAMAQSLSWSFDPAWERKTPVQLYEHFITPAYQADDPISRETPYGAISTSSLTRYYVTPTFDVSPPVALTITHPEITQTQAKACRELANVLDPVRLTEYDITIHLANGSACAHRWGYAINRYLALFPSERNADLAFDASILCNAAQVLFRDVLYSADPALRTVLLDEAQIHITKTFGEEALATVLLKDRPLVAYYVDLAMLAFCSMGLAVEITTFRGETGVDRF